MAWYDAGTVKVTVNSATVTGNGTKWLAGARQGEAFVAPDGRLYEVLNIASDISLTLTKPYIGATATGQKYALAPMQGYVKELADRVAALLLLSQEEWGSVLKAVDLQASPNDATNGKVLTVGRAFGLGSGTSAPPNGRTSVNPFGWYYKSDPAPSWGGGQFFLDMPYGSHMNAGLRLSTDPYSENFYLQGGVANTKGYNQARKLVHDRNIVGDLATGSVIANGSNANGVWIRYADGTQICISHPITSDWVDSQSGQLWHSPSRNWVYPTWFHTAENVVMFGSAQESDIPLWITHGLTRNNTTGSYKIVSTIRWDNPLWVRLCAIGRWKA